MLAAELDRRARLTEEARDGLLVAERVVADELDRDGLIELLVAGRDDCSWRAATTMPMPPTPRTRSTRYFPARRSPSFTGLEPDSDMLG
ncbi:MAG: hypothetical protein ABSE49_36380 [Polyangiaceae bacterium]